MDFIIINMNVVKIYVDISTTDAIEYFLGLLRLNSTILRIYMISVSTCDLSMQVVSGFDGLTQDLWDAAVGVLGGTQESLKGQCGYANVMYTFQKCSENNTIRCCNCFHCNRIYIALYFYRSRIATKFYRNAKRSLDLHNFNHRILLKHSRSFMSRSSPGKKTAVAVE